MRSPTPAVLTSASNPRVRSALALRERREREQSGLTLVDGARELRRALEAGVEVVEAFVCEPLLAGPDARAALDRLRSGGAPLHLTNEAVFARMAFGERAEGLLAVVRIPSTALEGLVLPADPLLIVIEGVEKPGNVGAVLRSADGAGLDAVVAASPRTDPFNPNAIRASAGNGLQRAAGHGPDRARCWPGSVAPASASSPPGSTPRGCTRMRTSRVRSPSPSARRRTA